MIVERDLTPCLRTAALQFPAVTLTGPRQSGKSTLCRAVFPDHAYANLESPDVREQAQEDPRRFLSRFPGGVVLDEVQRAPELPSYLQPMIDEDPRPGRWILTGSQNFALMESVSQSLAGRSAVLHLLPLGLAEARRFEDAPEALDEVLFRGGYPAIFDRKVPAPNWLSAYVGTYLERDVRSLARIGDLNTYQRFLQLSAGRTAGLVNYSRLASDCGVSQPTAKAWLSILEASFLVYRLPAWSGGIRKRLVRMPKLHFLDSGLACWLLGLRAVEHLASHPLRGVLFESWVVSEVMKARANRGEAGGMFFYRDQHGAEADLVLETPTGFVVVEVKAGETVTRGLIAPLTRVTKVLSALRPTRAVVVYGGSEVQERGETLVLPWDRLELLDDLT